jgi:hypothetical protein
MNASITWPIYHVEKEMKQLGAFAANSATQKKKSRNSRNSGAATIVAAPL